ncbi:unnamed protein product [Medioppia subpectinata]|uniref:Protein kinase domain-containing protein n=1 Tax=Medioppia subpectinata TaxID=1979941 RepID=A0A7R9PZS0_9ACAR|nr:unnamed protein product [Medioppia subpectinata]CAG2106747.1 unnamed protein product [Medioppia subpectinata]
MSGHDNPGFEDIDPEPGHTSSLLDTPIPLYQPSLLTPPHSQSFLTQTIRFGPSPDRQEEYVIVRTPPPVPSRAVTPGAHTLSTYVSDDSDDSDDGSGAWAPSDRYGASVATNITSGDSDLQNISHPIERLQEAYEMADPSPGGQPVLLSSGVLNVSSADETGSRLGRWLNRTVGPQRGVDRLGRKTIRDLKKLRTKGFDVRYGKRRAIGTGNYGAVYSGVYTYGIMNLTERERQYLGYDIVPDRTQFAAKYVQFGGTGAETLMPRIYHEIEKQCMKRLANHTNIVAFRMAINLGQSHRVVRHRDQQQQHHHGDQFRSYERMFLIMELGDRGTLANMVSNSKINDILAVSFIRQLCSGMAYIHGKGITHGDAHSGNVLVFSSSGQTGANLTAKWTDFGRSLCRDHWSGRDMTDAEFLALIRTDVQQMVIILNALLECARTAGAANTGLDVQPVRRFVERLSQTNRSLDDELRLPFLSQTVEVIETDRNLESICVAQIPYDDCGHHEVHSVYVSGCAPGVSCTLHKAVQTNISVEFKANQDADKLEHYLHADIAGKDVDLIPMMGLDKDACKLLKCPIKKDEVRTLTYKFTIPKTMPNTDANVKSRLIGSGGDLYCTGTYLSVRD